MALALTAPELRAQDTLVVKLSLRTTDFSYGTQDGYDVINPKRDRMSHIMIPGHPQLPTWHPAYIIPYWKDIAYCEIVALDSIQIPGTWNIYPAQQEVPIGDSADWTPPDPAIYNSDSLYPGKLMLEPGSGVFDGARIINPNLYPMRYRPKSGRLFLYTSVKIKLVFKDADPPINAKQRYAHVQEIYDRMLVDLVENDGDIGAWYRRPAIIDPNGGKSLYPAFIIITTQDQANDASLLAYRDWMYQRGYPTTIQTIEWVLANYTGVDPAEELRKYIQDCYQLGVSYFLLLGHERDAGHPNGIPFRYLFFRYEDEGGGFPWNRVPSDIYFENLNGDWDGDNDGIYGEYDNPDCVNPDCAEFDLWPEVFVGRVLAENTFSPPANEIGNWVSKVLSYEKDPSEPSGLTHVFHSCGDDNMITYLYNATKDHYPQEFLNNLTSYGTGEDANDHLALMNNNRLGIVVVYTHGSHDYWACDLSSQTEMYSWPHTLDPGDAYLGQLANENKPFFSYNIACVNGAYDFPYPDPMDTCVAEAWVEAYQGKGAVANVAGTRTLDGAWHKSIYAEFLDIVFGNTTSVGFPGYLVGVAEAFSKPNWDASKSWWSCTAAYPLNDFGSPLTEVWTNVPVATATTVSPTSIRVNQSSTVRVTVYYGLGTPLNQARVTLYGCGVYQIGYTNPQGRVSFTITPTQTGTIKATATKHDYKPSQANIYVGLKGEVASDVHLPTEFFMSLSSSNPVKDNIKLQYGIPVEDEGLVSLKIYDVSGRAIRTVFSEEKSAGYYNLSVPTSSFSAGTYFLRLEAGAKAKTEKVVIK